jgi:hypothetical protein
MIVADGAEDGGLPTPQPTTATARPPRWSLCVCTTQLAENGDLVTGLFQTGETLLQHLGASLFLLLLKIITF